MSMTKRWVEDLQQKFAVNKFIDDGCPPEDAEKENWDSMVECLFDGDEELAWDLFVNYGEE